MAKPIAKTPPLEGKDAIAVLKKMQEPPTEKDKKSKDCLVLNWQS